MRMSAKGWIVGCTLALLGALALPSVASADCGYLCRRVSTNPTCFQCRPSSLPGVGCIQTSECSCIDEPNCPSPLALNAADQQKATLAAIFAPADEAVPAATM